MAALSWFRKTFRLTALTVRSLCLPRSSRQRSLPCRRVCALLRNGAWQSAACPRWKMRLPPILRLAPKPNIKSIAIGWCWMENPKVLVAWICTTIFSAVVPCRLMVRSWFRAPVKSVVFENESLFTIQFCVFLHEEFWEATVLAQLPPDLLCCHINELVRSWNACSYVSDSFTKREEFESSACQGSTWHSI